MLQIPDYGRAFMLGGVTTSTEEAVERKLQVLQNRQERLTSSDAPRLWAILSEAVPRRVVGSREPVSA